MRALMPMLKTKRKVRRMDSFYLSERFSERALDILQRVRRRLKHGGPRPSREPSRVEPWQKSNLDENPEIPNQQPNQRSRSDLGQQRPVQYEVFDKSKSDLGPGIKESDEDKMDTFDLLNEMNEGLASAETEEPEEKQPEKKKGQPAGGET